MKVCALAAGVFVTLFVPIAAFINDRRKHAAATPPPVPPTPSLGTMMSLYVDKEAIEGLRASIVRLGTQHGKGAESMKVLSDAIDDLRHEVRAASGSPRRD